MLDDVTDEFGSGYTRDEIFREAQRRVRWHYQWIVLHEFLPKTVGKSLVRAILDGRAEALQVAQRPVHPGGVLRRRVPVRAL